MAAHAVHARHDRTRGPAVTEGAQQSRTSSALEQRLVGEGDERSPRRRPAARRAHTQGRTRPVAVVVVDRTHDGQSGERGRHRLGAVSEHDHDVAHARIEQRLRDAPHQRHAVALDQRLRPTAHAPGLAGREHDPPSDRRDPPPGHAKRCRDSGSSRIGLPVSATSAFTTAGASGGNGGSPTPPIASPDSMMMVSMRAGECVMRSSG